MVSDPGSAPDRSPATLTEVLLHAAERAPHRGLGIFDGRGRRAERRLYPEVLAGARAAAARLQRSGVRPGERVLVCLPTSWPWMDHWLGALLLGALPVAVAPAGALGSSEEHTRRVAGIFERLDGRLLITGESFRQQEQELGLGLPRGAVQTPESLGELAPATDFTIHRPAPEEIAFLQLTSGSTGLPRAVMIRHRSAVHNNLASDEAIGAPHGEGAGRWADAMVSWLPLHHDMGLVGCFFLSLSLGLDLWLFNPTAFLARPRRWLEELGRHGKVFAPAPNFGYQLCVERIRRKQLEGVDLSGWRAAMTGAEMVRPETLDAFCELTADTGFRPPVFRPCYGLAEATLAVTFDRSGQAPRTLPLPAGADTGLGLNRVVCLGPAVRDTQVRIAAADGSTLPEGQVGEVRVQGPSIFAGYYNDPQATAEGLVDGWLCTGDLGFLHEGELYLTGRLKDLLILRGHNVMPHELEWLAEAVVGGGGALRSGAFSVARGTEGEQAVLVVETQEKSAAALTDLARQIRLRVSHAMSLPLADVAFVRRGKIPKTTSGKVQRRQLRQHYLAGELERLRLDDTAGSGGQET